MGETAKVICVIIMCYFLVSLKHNTNPNDSVKVNLILNDITPKFLVFYDSAARNNASENERWNLWKSLYDFAATPPTPTGDSIARKLLDNAWLKYGPVKTLLRENAAYAIYHHASTVLPKSTNLLKPDSSFNIFLRVYVGGGLKLTRSLAHTIIGLRPLYQQKYRKIAASRLWFMN